MELEILQIDMETIDQVVINFSPDQLYLLNILLAFLMFGVALDLKLDHFGNLFSHPKAPITGLFSQLILLPILTLALIFLFQPPVSLALGMIMVAACPGGNVSNFAVHLAGANSALSVLMTSISTLGAILITPYCFAFLSTFIAGADQLEQNIYVNPMSMISTIFQLVFIPLLLGMFLNRQAPIFTNRIKQPVKMLSILIFFGFVVFATIANWDNILSYVHLVFLLVLVHNALALSMGYWVATWNGLPQRDAQAISIETGIQNSGLGLLLIFNFFDGLGGMAMIAAWWGIWHLIAGFSLATYWSYKKTGILA